MPNKAFQNSHAAARMHGARRTGVGKKAYNSHRVVAVPLVWSARMPVSVHCAGLTVCPSRYLSSSLPLWERPCGLCADVAQPSHPSITLSSTIFPLPYNSVTARETQTPTPTPVITRVRSPLSPNTATHCLLHFSVTLFLSHLLLHVTVHEKTSRLPSRLLTQCAYASPHSTPTSLSA